MAFTNPNTQLISYADWMTSTYSRLYSRSPELQKIDAALKAGEEQAPDFASMLKWSTDLGSSTKCESARIMRDLDRRILDLIHLNVNTALSNWIRANSRLNEDWRKSNRNGSKAVETLYNQLSNLRSRLPTNERAAEQFILAERDKSIPALFADCKVVTYSDRLTTLADKTTAMSSALNVRTLYNDGNRVGMGAPTVADARGWLRDMEATIHGWIQDAFFGGEGGGGGRHLIDDTPVKQILDEAVGKIKDELAAIMPIAGVVTASKTFASKSYDLIKQSIGADDLVDLKQRLVDSDSRSAVTSVQQWQAETLARTATDFVRASAGLATHTAALVSFGIGAGVQIAVSAANALIALIGVIVELGLQYKRKKALERYLHQPALGRDIFAQSPLAAAYYLLNTPASHVALQIVRIGAPAWQDDVERMRRSGELSTAVSQAALLIEKSKYRIRKSDGAKYRENNGPTAISKIKDKLRGQPVLA